MSIASAEEKIKIKSGSLANRGIKNLIFIRLHSRRSIWLINAPGPRSVTMHIIQTRATSINRDAKLTTLQIIVILRLVFVFLSHSFRRYAKNDLEPASTITKLLAIFISKQDLKPKKQNFFWLNAILSRRATRFLAFRVFSDSLLPGWFVAYMFTYRWGSSSPVVHELGTFFHYTHTHARKQIRLIATIMSWKTCGDVVGSWTHRNRSFSLSKKKINIKKLRHRLRAIEFSGRVTNILALENRGGTIMYTKL